MTKCEKTKYEKPELVDLSAMEWETGVGQTNCQVGSAPAF